MNVTIVSPFRDSEEEVAAYRQRVAALDHPQEQLRLILVEGDSKDLTLARLWAWSTEDGRVTTVKCDTGKPRYGPVVDRERFKVLATVFNAGLNAVDMAWSDYTLFIPSDVLYQPDMITRLLAHGKDVIAPYFWNGNSFYDTWGFSRNGQFYTNFSIASVRETKPIRMDTVGGVILSRIAVLQSGVRYREEDVDRGYCEMAKALGFTIWADPTTSVWHR